MLWMIRGAGLLMQKGATWLGLGAVAGAVYFGYVAMKPELRADLHPEAQAIVTQAVDQLIEALPVPPVQRSILVLPVGNDRADHLFRDTLADALTASGKYAVINRTLTERALDMVNAQWTSQQATDADAVTMARRAGAQAALVAHFDRFQLVPPTALDLQYRLITVPDSPTGAPSQTAGSVTLSAYDLPAAQRAEGVWRPLPVGWAMLTYLLVVALLPIVAANLLANVMERHESNTVNAMLLLGLIAIDGLLLVFLMGFHLSGYIHGFVALTGIASAAAYNFIVLSKLEDMRSGM